MFIILIYFLFYQSFLLRAKKTIKDELITAKRYSLTTLLTISNSTARKSLRTNFIEAIKIYDGTFQQKQQTWNIYKYMVVLKKQG